MYERISILLDGLKLRLVIKKEGPVYICRNDLLNYLEVKKKGLCYDNEYTISIKRQDSRKQYDRYITGNLLFTIIKMSKNIDRVQNLLDTLIVRFHLSVVEDFRTKKLKVLESLMEIYQDGNLKFGRRCGGIDIDLQMIKYKVLVILDGSELKNILTNEHFQTKFENYKIVVDDTELKDFNFDLLIKRINSAILEK